MTALAKLFVEAVTCTVCHQPFEYLWSTDDGHALHIHARCHGDDLRLGVSRTVLIERPQWPPPLWPEIEKIAAVGYPIYVLAKTLLGERVARQMFPNLDPVVSEED